MNVLKFDMFSAELHPIPVKDEVWHTIGVDLIGPLPETQKETNTGASRQSPVCFPSGQRQLLSLTKQQQECMVEFLFLCFTRHGCCKVKISDQGIMLW